MNQATESDLVCFATLGSDQPWSLEAYRAVGGYESWERILRGVPGYGGGAVPDFLPA
jgi:NADH:ubiquinone oxidoreductase subunit F (NADH-binding)